MLIGEILNTTENVNYILAEFKQHLPGSVDEFDGKVLASFESKINQINVKGNPDIYAFFEYLASKEMSPFINQLKKAATKKKPFSFERLSFVTLPLFKYLEQKKVGNAGELKKIVGCLD
mgnify:FL=1